MRAIVAGLLVAVACGLVAWSRMAAAGGNPSALLHISRQAFDSNPLLRERTAVREALVFDSGYDAQYSYFATFDPLLTRYAHALDNYVLMMDSAPYRYGRIGHVWLTRALAGDRWRSYPLTLVLIAIGAVGILGWAVARVSIAHGGSPWWGLAVAAIPGYWQSVQSALPEPLAAAAVLVGYLWWRRDRDWAAVPWFAWALLTRETTLLAIVALTLGRAFTTGRWLRGAALLGGALLPWILWRVHIGLTLAPAFGHEAWFFNPGTFDWPLAGLVEAGRRMFLGVYHPSAPELSRAAVVFGALVTTSAIWALLWAWRQPAVETVAAAGYGLMALCLSGITVWNHPGNAQRTSSELFLWLLVALLAAPATPHHARTRAIWVVACALFVLIAAHDAAIIRAAFGLP